jgi:hypothetical protein
MKGTRSREDESDVLTPPNAEPAPRTPPFRRYSTKRAAAGFSGSARFCSAQRTTSTRSSWCVTRHRGRALGASLKGRQWREARPLACSTAPPPPVRCAFEMSEMPLSVSRTIDRRECPAARTFRLILIVKCPRRDPLEPGRPTR